MKIRYKKIIRSTHLDLAILLKKIFTELDKPGYIIIDQNQSSVKFKYNIWRIGSRAKAFKNVDGGMFSISPENKTITLSYYLSPTFEIIMVCIGVFFGFTKDHHFFFFVIFSIVLFILRLMSVMINAHQMMDDIAGKK